MFVWKLPSPPLPWRPCLPPPGAPLPRIRIAPFGRRRQLLLPLSVSSSSSTSRSKDSPLHPAKPFSSKRGPDEIGRWKSVPPGMRRIVASWVPRKARSVVLLNVVTFILGTDARHLAFLSCVGCTSSVRVYDRGFVLS
jgi:hypothetical protein